MSQCLHRIYNSVTSVVDLDLLKDTHRWHQIHQYDMRLSRVAWLLFFTRCDVFFVFCFSRNIEILKKSARPGFSIWDCAKGTGEINVPIHYLIAYCRDLDHTADYDDMFHTGIYVIECHGSSFLMILFRDAPIARILNGSLLCRSCDWRSGRSY